MNTEKTLGIICARGGSKGLPGKNIRQLQGKPLLAWTIEAAKGASRLDRVILSSDCDDIIQVAKTYGCEVPFIRDSRLAQDETPGMDVVLDAITHCNGYAWTVLLQPTSPLRQAQDIDKAIQQCIHLDAPACVSVCEVRDNPHWMYRLSKEQHLQALFAEQPARRQDLPTYYALNGAIYVARTSWLLQHGNFLSPDTVAYVMPLERSIDIDTALDFHMVEAILNSKL